MRRVDGRLVGALASLADGLVRSGARGVGVGYRRTDRRYDVVAGIMGSALVVPNGGLGVRGHRSGPVENGRYASATVAVLYAIFGTS